MSDYKVAFVGLPSSGKSSIINSLAFKRLLESGVCRTTTDKTELNNILIEDDKGNKFKVIDLPGICDSEEQDDNNFNNLTKEAVLDANLVIWVSEINKAFITTHEVNEFNSLRDYINNETSKIGKLIKVIILLSKCDQKCYSSEDTNKEDNLEKLQKEEMKTVKKAKAKAKAKANAEIKEIEEIDDNIEDTDINDLENKVRNKFTGTDIMLFNAYGRSFHSDKSSGILKKFVSRTYIPSHHNIKFDISKYYKNYDEDQKISYYNKFLTMFDKWKNGDVSIELKDENIPNNKIELNRLDFYWKNITFEYQKDHFVSVIATAKYELHININYNYKYYRYLEFVNGKNIPLVKTNGINLSTYYSVLLRYLIHMLNYPEYLLSTYNFCADYDYKKVISKVIEILNNIKLEPSFYISCYKNILFYDTIKYIEYTVEIIKAVHKKYTLEELDFHQYFNEFIKKTTDKEIFNRFYSVIIKCYEIKELTIDQNLSPYDKFCKLKSYLETTGKTTEFILINKLEVLYNLYNGCHTVYPTLKKCLDSNIAIKNRLFNNHNFQLLLKEIYNMIYSNILIDYDNDDYSSFEPIDKIELMYFILY